MTTCEQAPGLSGRRVAVAEWNTLDRKSASGTMARRSLQNSQASPTPSVSQPDDAFVRSLYSEHGEQLLGFALRLTGGDRHWAEDVRQETLLRAWRHADQLQHSAHPSVMPWLKTVARHIISNDRRRRRCRPHEVDDTMLNVARVDDDTDQALQRIVIVDALRRISHAQRTVVVELYLRGRTVEEVAAMMQIPAGTVKSRAYYAVRTLRELLAPRALR
jgi:RNA polymerase sigma-70 factor, ECF subfamily